MRDRRHQAVAVPTERRSGMERRSLVTRRSSLVRRAPMERRRRPAWPPARPPTWPLAGLLRASCFLPPRHSPEAA